MEDSTSTKVPKVFRVDEMMRTSGSSEHLYDLKLDENKNRQQPQTERERSTPGDPVFE